MSHKNNLFFLALALTLVGGTFLTATPVLGQTGLTVNIIAPPDNADLLVNQQVTFTGSASGGSGFYTYIWNFGDNTQAGGHEVVKTYTATGRFQVTLTVTDTDGLQGSASIYVNVNQPPTLPTVDLRANGLDGSITVPAGSSVTLSWVSTDATSCTASDNWLGNKPTNGSESTGPLNAGSYLYTLTCTGPGGSASDSVGVEVSQSSDTTPPTTPAILSSSHQPGVATTTPAVSITWSQSVDNESGLAGYSFVWDQNVSTTPDVVVDTTATSLVQTLAPGTWYFHLVAVDHVGNRSIPTTHYGPIIIQSGNSEPPVISNLHVTDVTSSSAIVRWTTDRLADSRVIYDTVSHPNIQGQSPPNFGYAFSTATQDSQGVTEHAVMITSLSANTTYYFRALSRSIS